MIAFGLALFGSAFLLFQVQPIMGRFLLPGYGGSPAVWTTCLCFFQVLLVLGYLYAHALARWRSRWAIVVHAAAVCGSLAWLPIFPAGGSLPSNPEAPVRELVELLLRTVGPCYLLLATTSPLLQAWFSRVYPGRSPYRLFALSNAGSLGALVSYPVLWEPQLTLRHQAWVWSCGYGMFLGILGVCCWLVITWGFSPADGTVTESSEDQVAPRPTWRLRGLWLLLAFVPSVLLLGVTNELSQEVAAAPLLWIMPLCVYLLSFIVSFDHPRWYQREFYGVGLTLTVAAALGCLPFATQIPYEVQLAVYCAMLWCACMVGHGELARMRPAPRYLTGFYLCLSIGGAAGGLFVVFVAPLWFRGYYEFPLAMLGILALAAVVWTRGAERSGLVRILCYLSIVAAVGLWWGYFQYRDLWQQSIRGRWTLTLGVWGMWLLAWAWQYWPVAETELGSGTRIAAGGRRHVRVWLACGWLAVTCAVYAFSFQMLAHSEGWGTKGPAVLMLVLLAVLGVAIGTRGAQWSSRTLWGVIGLAYGLFLGQSLFFQILSQGRGDFQVLEVRRSFFGISGVQAGKSPLVGPFLEIFNGRIGHGRQFLRPEWSRVPNLYYGPDSGVGLAFRQHPRRLAGQSLRVGVIGLGTGSLVTWGQPGDTFDFFEINPDVVALAKKHFTYLSESVLAPRVEVGDARVILATDAQAGRLRKYDLLIVDAFTSDSIPRHLLTREAAELYRRHVAADGLAAIHISNHFLDLRGVVMGMGRAVGWTPYQVFDERTDRRPGNEILNSSNWMILTDQPQWAQQPEVAEHLNSLADVPTREWTDDFGSPLQVMVWRRPSWWPQNLWPKNE